MNGPQVRCWQVHGITKESMEQLSIFTVVENEHLYVSSKLNFPFDPGDDVVLVERVGLKNNRI